MAPTCRLPHTDAVTQTLVERCERGESSRTQEDRRNEALTRSSPLRSQQQGSPGHGFGRPCPPASGTKAGQGNMARFLQDRKTKQFETDAPLRLQFLSSDLRVRRLERPLDSLLFLPLPRKDSGKQKMMIVSAASFLREPTPLTASGKAPERPWPHPSASVQSVGSSCHRHHKVDRILPALAVSKGSCE